MYLLMVWSWLPFGAALYKQGDNRGEDAVDIAGFYNWTYDTATMILYGQIIFYWKRYLRSNY